MATPLSIRCPKCGETFEPGDALMHQIGDELIASEREKHEKAMAAVRVETAKEVSDRLTQESKIRMSQLEKDAAEEKDRNRKLLRQLEETLEEMRKLRRRQEEMELENRKKLAEEEGKIRDDARKKAMQEHELKDLEKDKIISDYKKKAEELQEKLTRGSQQNQGEVLELALEELLRKDFPRDVIEEVKKGQRGADIVQHVHDRNGNECGVILWESKNAQWSDAWIPKLKDDQRSAKADLAILVVTNMPKGQEHYFFDNDNRIWICPRTEVTPLALALSWGLVKVRYERSVQSGKDEKKEILYQYITSLEFRSRMEAITEAFTAMQDEVEREKRWFSTKWARQEKQLRKVVDNAHGMYGDLQGVIGSLPELTVKDTDKLPASGDPMPLLEDKPF